MAKYHYSLERLGYCSREFRWFAGMTRVELARRAGISRDLLQKLEQRKHVNPGLAALIGIADALGITVGDLLAGITTPSAEQIVPPPANPEPLWSKT